MSRIHGFPPVADGSARLLILGSMPGVESLRAGQYYAHPRNTLWRILGELLGAGPERGYAERCEQLRRSGVALWDVLASCARAGSLDAAITAATANDIGGFLAAHPRVHCIVFNGAKAESSFRRLVLGGGGAPLAGGRAIRYLRLPSTSPAHAALGYEAKRAQWAQAFAAAGIVRPRSR